MLRNCFLQINRRSHFTIRLHCSSVYPILQVFCYMGKKTFTKDFSCIGYKLSLLFPIPFRKIEKSCCQKLTSQLHNLPCIGFMTGFTEHGLEFISVTEIAQNCPFLLNVDIFFCLYNNEGEPRRIRKGGERHECTGSGRYAGGHEGS